MIQTKIVTRQSPVDLEISLNEVLSELQNKLYATIKSVKYSSHIINGSLAISYFSALIIYEVNDENNQSGN